VAAVARVGVDRQDRVRLLIVGGVAEQRGGPQRAERPRSRLAVRVLPHGDEHMPEGQAVAVDGHLSGVEPGPLPEVPLRGRGGSGLSPPLPVPGRNASTYRACTQVPVTSGIMFVMARFASSLYSASAVRGM